ncbi:MAG: PAS domain-containing protein [Hyphomicrobiales bacterium]|uniref:PAS domain-containing protein n=1 Tax=Nisaea sp. TaxID=2024842 RepID=UPI0032726060
MEKHIRSNQFDHSGEKPEKLMADANMLMQLVMRSEKFGSWRLDMTTGQVMWSETVYRIHGMEPEPGPINVGKAISLYHPDDAKTVEYLINDAISHKRGFDFVLRLNRADGKMRFVEAIASVELTKSGSVTAIYGVFRDVTERINDRNISETRGQMVNSIITNSPSPLVIVDRDMRYVQISPAWAEFHKLENPTSFIGKSHYEVLPDVPKAWREEHQRALKGEVIYRKTALEADERSGSRMFGSVVFPWRTSSNKIGGLIIMVTSLAKSKEENTGTVRQIAGLMKHTGSRQHRFGEIR